MRLSRILLILAILLVIPLVFSEELTYDANDEQDSMQVLFDNLVDDPPPPNNYLPGGSPANLTSNAGFNGLDASSVGLGVGGNAEGVKHFAVSFNSTVMDKPVNNITFISYARGTVGGELNLEIYWWNYTGESFVLLFSEDSIANTYDKRVVNINSSSMNVTNFINTTASVNTTTAMFYAENTDGSTRNIDTDFFNFTVTFSTPVNPPTVALNSPNDGHNLTVSTFDFNSTCTQGDNPISNLTLWSNLTGSWAATQNNASTVTSGSQFVFEDIALSNGGYVWNTLCTDDQNNQAFATANYTVNVSIPGLTAILETPADNFITSSSSQDFQCSASATANNIDNVTFTLWDSISGVEATTFRDLTNGLAQNESFSVAAITDETYVWNCEYTDVTNFKAIAPNNFTFTRDGTSPTITIEHPTGLLTTTSVSLNFTANDTNRDVCQYSLNGATNVTLASCANTTLNNVGGNNNVIVYVNDTANNLASSQSNFTIVNVSIEAPDLLELEGEDSIFSIFISNGSATLTSGVLFYNTSATSYDNAISNGTGILINKTVRTPIIGNNTNKYENVSFAWNLTFRLDGNEVNISRPFLNQTVYQKFLGDCSAYPGNLSVNYTTLDEETNATLNGTFSHLYSPRDEDGIEIRTYNFTDTSQPSSDVCIFPSWGNFSANTQVQYSFNDSAVYDIRDYIFNDQGFNNVTRDVVLLLLKQSTSTDVTINVRDQNDNNLEGYNVEAYKFNVVTNGFDLVQTGVTDFSGKTLFQLDNTQSYRFIISLDGNEVLRTENVKIIGASPELFFIVTIGSPTISTILDDVTTNITHGLVFNGTGSDNIVNFSWVANGAIFNQFCLTINNFTLSDDTQITNQCSTSTSSSLNFNMTNFFGSDYVANTFAYTTADGTKIPLSQLVIELKPEDRLIFYGNTTSTINDGLFWSMATVGVLGGVGLSTGNPAVTIILTTIGVVLAFVMKLTVLAKGAIIALAVLGAALIYILRT